MFARRIYQCEPAIPSSRVAFSRTSSWPEVYPYTCMDSKAIVLMLYSNLMCFSKVTISVCHLGSLFSMFHASSTDHFHSRRSRYYGQGVSRIFLPLMTGFTNSFRFEGASPTFLDNISVTNFVICTLSSPVTRIRNFSTSLLRSASRPTYPSPLLFAGFSTRPNQDSASRKQAFLLMRDFVELMHV
jgi:hypothetical protein